MDQPGHPFFDGVPLSYEVIARRWRPQDFSKLIGQDHIRTTLINALKHDRLHHALLFTGPRGTGKTSSARILAKSLRCPNAVDFVPCNTCSECEEIAAGRSINVIEIDGASNNGVDAIRELRDTVGYLPSSGKFKLYIIDEVHMLSTSAFNALLKTLEEPPEHVYFIMATTEIQKIPATILSRCQRFDFRRIPTRVIAQHLQTICENDKVEFESDALWVIARQGDGSMRDAQSLLDQVINFTNGKLSRDLVVGTLGLTDRGLLQDVMAGVMAGRVNQVVEKLNALHMSGGDPRLFLLDVLEQVRNALLIKLEGDRALIDLPDSEIQALAQMAQPLAQEDLHWLFDMALKGAQDLSRAPDPLLVLEMVLMRMAAAPRWAFTATQASATPMPVAPKPTAQAPRAAPSAPATRPVPQAPAAPSAAPPAANLPSEQKFKQLVEKIKEVNSLIGAQLENCFVAQMDSNALTLGVSAKHKFLFDKINQPDFKKKVLNYVTTFWGPGFSLEITLSEPGGADEKLTPKGLADKQEADRQAAIRQAVEAHPLVQSAQSVFKAEIKAIKEIKS